jgi:hypothetical protein
MLAWDHMVTFHVRLLARLLAHLSILTVVAHHPTTSRTSSAFNSLTLPQPANEGNNYNHSNSSNESSPAANDQTKEQWQQSPRSFTDRLPISIFVGIHYQISAVDKVSFSPLKKKNI